MLNIVIADGRREQAVIAAMRERAASANQTIETAVRAIMQSVKEEGFPAVRPGARCRQHPRLQ